MRVEGSMEDEPATPNSTKFVARKKKGRHVSGPSEGSIKGAPLPQTRSNPCPCHAPTMSGDDKMGQLSGLMFFHVERKEDGAHTYSLGCFSSGKLEMIPMEQTYTQPLVNVVQRLRMNAGIARTSRAIVQHAQALHKFWDGNDEIVQGARARLRADRERNVLLEDTMELKKRCLSFIEQQFDQLRAAAQPPPQMRTPQSKRARVDGCDPTPSSQLSQVSTLLNETPPAEALPDFPPGGWDPLFTPGQAQAAAIHHAASIPGTPLLATPSQLQGVSHVVTSSGGGGGGGGGGRLDFFHQAAARHGEHVRVLVAQPVLRREPLVQLEEPGLPRHVVAHAEVAGVALAHALEGQEAHLGEGGAVAEVGGDVEEGVVAVGPVEVRDGLHPLLGEGLQQGLERRPLLAQPRAVLADGVFGAGMLQQNGYDVMGGLQNLSAQDIAFLQSPQLHR